MRRGWDGLDVLYRYMTDVTRISELPENITVQIQQHSSSPQGEMGQHTYVPMNVHPNPYGISQQAPGGMPYPQGSPQRNAYSDQGQGQGQGQGQAQGQAMLPRQYDPNVEVPIQQHRLPSRDIPMNSVDFQQDEEIKPNYVPKAKLTSDYIRTYEVSNEEATKKHKEKKHRETLANTMFSNLQLPILVALLYFIFQLPIVTTMLRKNFSFLSIYHEDGNINFTGMILKSAVFGMAFYGAQSFAETVGV